MRRWPSTLYRRRSASRRRSSRCPRYEGATVDLGAYRGRQNVIVWFSRGFTCPFCRGYMQGIIEGYQGLLAAEAEVIQVAPNLLEAARSFFRPAPVPYPVVCDPDKRLYAVYGLGDRGALVATRTGLVSFARAFTTGDGGPPDSRRMAGRGEPELRAPPPPPCDDRGGAGSLRRGQGRRDSPSHGGGARRHHPRRRSRWRRW